MREKKKADKYKMNDEDFIFNKIMQSTKEEGLQFKMDRLLNAPAPQQLSQSMQPKSRRSSVSGESNAFYDPGFEVSHSKNRVNDSHHSPSMTQKSARTANNN
jgi:hypothetical protein